MQLDELKKAYHTCRYSNYKEGREQLVEAKTKLLSSKCIIISKCMECPFYSWAGEGFCLRAGQVILAKNEIADFCPLDGYNSWDKILWGQSK